MPRPTTALQLDSLEIKHYLADSRLTLAAKKKNVIMHLISPLEKTEHALCDAADVISTE